MKNKTILAIIMVAIMLVGCGVDERTSSKAVEKKEEIAQVDEVESVLEEVSGKEDAGTSEERTEDVVEENATETVPAEQVQPEEVQKTETKKVEQRQTQTKSETPTVTTPVVNAPVVATPEPEVKVENCEHWYQPVETEEYDRIEPHYIFGCNGCGFPLFTIDPETHDAVNIEDLYFHRECYSEKLGMMCPKPSAWHSEVYYQGWCYCCHSEIQLRACTYFYVMAETCIQNAGDLGGYEKVEEGHAYIKSCDCGQNILMTDGETRMGLMVKKEVCSYCGDIKTYPEK